jgi:hypothetical protein
MRAEQRPQVYAGFTPVDSFSYDANGATISLATIYQNTGHALALNVAGVISIFLLGQQDYKTVLGSTCNSAKKQGEFMGFPLFPGTRVEGKQSSNISQDELNKRVGVNATFLSPIIVTCVAYRIPDDPEFHFTVFTYKLTMLHPSAGLAISREETIPAKDLQITLFPLFPGFAN